MNNMPIPKMIPVTSSHIVSIGHDGENLYIQFKDGALYIYYKVPQAIYQNMMAAESKGSILHRMIDKAYRYERLE